MLDVLSYMVPDSGEVASCIRVKDAEARRLLALLERRGEIVATPGGGWHRLAAEAGAAAAVSRLPVARSRSLNDRPAPRQ